MITVGTVTIGSNGVATGSGMAFDRYTAALVVIAAQGVAPSSDPRWIAYANKLATGILSEVGAFVATFHATATAQDLSGGPPLGYAIASAGDEGEQCDPGPPDPDRDGAC